MTLFPGCPPIHRAHGAEQAHGDGDAQHREDRAGPVPHDVLEDDGNVARRDDGRQRKGEPTVVWRQPLLPADLDRYLSKPLQFFTEKTIRDPDALRAQLTLVRTQGFASTRDEFEEGLVAFAAPISSEPDQILAAVTIAGPSYRFPINEDQKFIGLIKQTAAEITHKVL